MNKNFVKYIVGVFVLLTFVALLMPKQQNRENVFLRDEDSFGRRAVGFESVLSQFFFVVAEGA